MTTHYITDERALGELIRMTALTLLAQGLDDPEDIVINVPDLLERWAMKTPTSYWRT